VKVPELHGVKEPEPLLPAVSRQSKPVPPSEELKVQVGVVSLVTSCGEPVRLALGALVSRVKLSVAGVPSVLFDWSLARTSNRYGAPALFGSVEGVKVPELQALKEPDPVEPVVWFRRHSKVAPVGSVEW
jgi:hypothetical protein